MNLKHTRFLLAVCALVGATAWQATAQNNASNFWIRVADDFAAADTAICFYVNTPAGTYGIDSVSPNYKEFEPPPSPPTGLWVLWSAYRPPAAGAYGGFGQWNPPAGPSVPFDIHGIPTNATVKDTFQLSIQYFGTDADFSDFHLRWPGASYIAARCDSMVLVAKTLGLLDGTGNPIPARLDMKSTDHLDLQQPIQNAGTSTFRFQIYRYGVNLIDDLGLSPTDAVREISNRVPSSFSLGQNYPNPFNPSTTIRFDIQKRATADIAVYNLLGEKVATLVAGNLSAGTYSTTWNGVTAQGIPASSGVYFVRMTALSLDGKAEAFSSLRKIVLMK